MDLPIRFRLRTLLIAVAVFSIVLGVLVERARRQREAVAYLRQHGCIVTYDYQMAEAWIDSEARSRLPERLLDSVGVDYFHSVDCVVYHPTLAGVFNGSEARSAHGPVLQDCEGAAIIAAAASFHRLRILQVPNADDESLRRLAALTSLRILIISDCAATDEGIAALGSLKELEYLAIDGSDLTDETLRCISGLSNLQELRIWGNFTDQGLEHVSRLPNLRVLWISTRLSRGPGFFTDNGLSHLGRLRTLEELGVGSPLFTEDGLTHLEPLTRLKTLDLDGCRKLDLSRLRAALPETDIMR